MHGVILHKGSRWQKAFFIVLLGSYFLSLYSCDAATGPPKEVRELALACLHKKSVGLEKGFSDPEIVEIKNIELSEADKASGIQKLWLVKIKFLWKHHNGWNDWVEYLYIKKMNNSYSCGK